MNRRLLVILGSISLIVLTICLVYAEQIITPAGLYVYQTRNIDGSMTFTVRTVTYNGAYGPRNAGAIWITNGQNQFVKTLKVWASQYRYTLVRWLASSGNNTTGAVTSASLNSHQLHTVNWNARNLQGGLVDDGNYTVNVEFTEHNASQNNPGKYKTVTFSKSLTAIDQTYPNETYFRDIRMIWAPIVPNGTLSGTVVTANSTPIEGAIIMAGTATAFSAADGSYSISLTPGNYDVTCMKDGYHTESALGVAISSGEITNQGFILESVVANDDPSAPNAEFYLRSPIPNPFHDSALISYKLPREESATLRVFNQRGQVIRSLELHPDRSGSGEIRWDGRDRSGSAVSAGIYFAAIEIDGRIAWQRLIRY